MFWALLMGQLEGLVVSVGFVAVATIVEIEEEEATTKTMVTTLP